MARRDDRPSIDRAKLLARGFRAALAEVYGEGEPGIVLAEFEIAALTTVALVLSQEPDPILRKAGVAAFSAKLAQLTEESVVRHAGQGKPS